MISANQIFRDGYKANNPQVREIARDLEEEGLGEFNKDQYIKCTSWEDDDYDIADYEGCERKIPISAEDCEEGYTRCECGRVIALEDKTIHSQFSFSTDQVEVRDYIRETISDELDLTKGREESLTYFAHRFEDRVIDFDIDRIRDDERINTTVRVHFCFKNLRDETVDAVKLYGRESIFILIGDGVLNEVRFRENDIPTLTFDDFYNTDSDTLSEKIWSRVDQTIATDELTDIARRAAIAKELYEDNRGSSETRDDVIDEDDFEHITNNLLNYCFKTSTIFGSTDSGKPVPDGVLCLQSNDRARAYLWDAKYSEPDSEPHELSSSDQENMTKYPVTMRDLSNVGDGPGEFNEFAGFLLISPEVKETHVVGLAKKISKRYEERNEIGGLPVIHLRIDALIRLYDLLRRNASGAQKQINWVRFEFDNLLQRTSYHFDTPEYPDAPDELTVIDVSADEVDELFESNLEPDDTAFAELNYESIRRRIEKLNF